MKLKHFFVQKLKMKKITLFIQFWKVYVVCARTLINPSGLLCITKLWKMFKIFINPGIMEKVSTYLSNWTHNKAETDNIFVQETEIEENNFVYSILKTLCRMCQDANQPSWSSMYNKIVKNVQDIYKSRHNGKSLYLSFKLNA